MQKIWILNYASTKYSLLSTPNDFKVGDGYDNLRNLTFSTPSVFTNFSDILAFIHGNNEKIIDYKIIRRKPKTLLPILNAKGTKYTVPSVAEIILTYENYIAFITVTIAKI